MSERSRPSRRFLQSLEHGFKGLLADRDYAGATGLFYDSTCETRWGHPTLSGLWVVDTAWTPHHITSPYATDLDIIGGLNFDAECWVFHGQTVSTVKKLYARRYSETNEDWDQVEEVATGGAGTPLPLAACVGGDKMYVLYTEGSPVTLYLRSRRQGSSTWTNHGITSGPAIANVTRAKMMSIGNRLYLATWNSNTGVVSMYYSTDDGDNFTAGAATVISKYPLTGMCAYGDVNGIMIPYLGTAEGVWYYDLNGANPYKIYDLTLFSDQWNCMGMAFWEATGELIVPLGAFPLGQLKALRYKSGGGVEARDMGLNLGAGLPVARQGRIIQVLPTPQFLYVLTRNAGNTEAGIFVLEYNWHHSFDSDRSGAAGIGWPTTGSPKSQLIAISNVDGTQRLHLIWDNGTNADGAHTKWPLQDPTTTSGFNTEASGILDLPYFAGGLPEIPGLWLQGHVDAANLSAANTGEYIKWTFGADSVARTTTTPGGSGEFLSGAKTLGFASTNVGTSAKNMGHRLVLNRDAGNTTDTPILYSFVTEFLKLPTPRHVWRFLVDLDALNDDTTRDKETAISALKTAETSVTQVTFSCGGDAQVYVKLLPPSPQFGLAVAGEDPLETLDRTGTVEITAVELI